jgi:NTE family protein
MCLPGVLPPVAVGDRTLVDGSVLDNLPITPMLEEADGPIIASDVASPHGAPSSHDGSSVQPGLFETLSRTMLLGRADGDESGRREADLYISPSDESVGAMEFHMLDYVREAGRRAALDALESAPQAVFG